MARMDKEQNQSPDTEARLGRFNQVEQLEKEVAVQKEEITQLKAKLLDLYLRVIPRY